MEITEEKLLELGFKYDEDRVLHLIKDGYWYCHQYPNRVVKTNTQGESENLNRMEQILKELK